jgi:ABC-type branched-subunit amino acid transport system ATPase component
VLPLPLVALAARELEMARALMTDPTLVMLDEPMAGVNPALTQSLLDHILDLKEEGMTVLFVEHDMHMVRHIADWVVVMAEGKVVDIRRETRDGFNFGRVQVKSNID